jgi:predicted transposase/invertase (TIGR01784 family)
MNILKYLDPKNDAAFKKIFGSEQNKDILMHFLNDVLGSFREVPIVEIDFLPTILQPENREKKTSLIDVLCKDAQGTKYIIEMQVTKARGFEKRAQYYASKVYGNQANIGDEYHALKEVIFIAIADCVIFPNKPHYKSDHVILDKVTYEYDLKDFSFTFIELPKFNKRKENLSSIEEKWCYFFKHAHETTEAELQKVIGKDAIMHRAYTALDQFYWTEKELAAYDALKKIHMDNKAVMAQQIYEAVEKNKIETARRLLQGGCGIDMIVQATDLSKEQIEELQNKDLFVA